MTGLYKIKDNEEKSDDEFDCGFKIPDTKSLLQRLDSSFKEVLQQEHKEQTKEDDKNGVKKKQKPKGGTICMCESPGCSIGPFIEKQGE